MLARCSVALVLAPAIVSFADVYTYECDILPQPAGWILNQAFCGCPPEPCEGNQWIEDGNLFQQHGLCKGYGGANFVSHKKPITETSTTDEWFAEWRMVTDGISEEIPELGSRVGRAPDRPVELEPRLLESDRPVGRLEHGELLARRRELSLRELQADPGLGPALLGLDPGLLDPQLGQLDLPLALAVPGGGLRADGRGPRACSGTRAQDQRPGTGRERGESSKGSSVAAGHGIRRSGVDSGTRSSWRGPTGVH